jgi:hypothetical protein
MDFVFSYYFLLLWLGTLVLSFHVQWALLKQGYPMETGRGVGRGSDVQIIGGAVVSGSNFVAARIFRARAFMISINLFCHHFHPFQKKFWRTVTGNLMTQ